MYLCGGSVVRVRGSRSWGRVCCTRSLACPVYGALAGVLGDYYLTTLICGL